MKNEVRVGYVATCSIHGTSFKYRVVQVLGKKQIAVCQANDNFEVLPGAPQEFLTLRKDNRWRLSGDSLKSLTLWSVFRP